MHNGALYGDDEDFHPQNIGKLVNDVETFDDDDFEQWMDEDFGQPGNTPPDEKPSPRRGGFQSAPIPDEIEIPEEELVCEREI